MPKSEIGWMRAIACVAIIVMTIALALLNVTGAWIASKNVFYTGVILGVEFLAATCLVLVIAAPTMARKIVGAVIMTGLIWVCVENGKMAVKESFAAVFPESAEALLKKAELARADASDMKAEAPTNRDAVAEEIAALKVEQELMASPVRVKEAQQSLQSRGLYTGNLDGIYGGLTKEAMLSRGDVIRRRLEVLQQKAESGATPASDQTLKAIEYEAQAKEVRDRTVWMHLLLYVIEGARTAGLWAFVIWSGARRVMVDPSVFQDLQRDADELAQRKANLGEGQEKAKKTKSKKKRVEETRLAIADMREKLAEREEVLRQEEAAEPEPEAEPDAPADEAPPEPPANDTDEDDDKRNRQLPAAE